MLSVIVNRNEANKREKNINRRKLDLDFNIGKKIRQKKCVTEEGKGREGKRGVTNIP